MNDTPTTLLKSPQEARRRAERLLDRRAQLTSEAQRLAERTAANQAYLAIAEKVGAALEHLSAELFQQFLNIVQQKLTLALQEILEQPLTLRADSDFKRGAATVDFYIERDGKREDILRGGQGGSVTNILSVGLRLFALTTLDEAEHRRFLVLDEQDCWLRPDLVPRFVKMIRDAGQALGFQILMISHHDVGMFRKYADKLYELRHDATGTVVANEVPLTAAEPDVE
jgi:hypothetical protein